MPVKVIETRVFKTWLTDGVCHTKVKYGSIVDLADAIENTEIVALLSEDLVYPMLVDLREINSITKEARDHFSMRGRKAGVSAIGILIKSPVSSIIGNFFLGLNKSTVPTKLFTIESRALEWLEQYSPN